MGCGDALPEALPMKLTAPLRIGTRGRRWRWSRPISSRRAARIHGLEDEAVEIVRHSAPPATASRTRPLAEVGGTALWTKELDRALLDGETDLSCIR
jgi:hydroxymethylbilane synthase